MIIIDQNTVSEVATYTEPITSQDGSPLADLAYTYVEYHVGTNPPVLGPHVPATKPSGGGNITTTVIFNAPAGVQTTVIADVKAVDLNGNTSSASNSVTSVIDRVAPAAPTGFTLA